jgi:hypothetical protein
VCQVASEFGLPEAVGLAAMRQATQLLPGDEEVFELSLYRKFNRCVDGGLRAGDTAPDATLLPLQAASHDLGVERAETVSLLALLRGDRAAWRASASPINAPPDEAQSPLVLFVGSYT